MNNIYAIILSGGAGSRMGGDVPKQFLQLNGSPILTHSVQRFINWGLCKKIVIVSHPDFLLKTEEILSPFLGQEDRIVEGGSDRHASFLKGLEVLNFDKSDIVLVHDAARPFFTEKELYELVDTTLQWGSASLGSKPTETLVHAEGNKTKEIIDRDKTYLIKTPQCFHTSILEILFSENNGPERPTDLSSWTLPNNIFTRIVDSNPYNLKITQREDLKIAEAYFDLFESWSKSAIN